MEVRVKAAFNPPVNLEGNLKNNVVNLEAVKVKKF